MNTKENFHKIVDALHGRYSNENPNSATCCCVAHDDRNASLSISLALDKNGNEIILVKCFAGCSQESIIDALKSRSLWGGGCQRFDGGEVEFDAAPGYELPEDDTPDPWDEDRELALKKELLEEQRAQKEKRENEQKRAEKQHKEWKGKDEYVYYSEAGEPLYCAVKHKFSDGSKAVPIYKITNGKLDKETKVTDSERVIYRANKLKNVKTIFFVEGEKDADRLVHEGVEATCIAGGSNAKWHDQFTRSLKNKKIIIIPDNDEPGHKFALRVAQQLDDVASAIKVLAPFELGKGADVSDWLDAGGSVESLKEIVRKTPNYIGAPSSWYGEDDRDRALIVLNDHYSSLRWSIEREEWMLYADGVWQAENRGLLGVACNKKAGEIKKRVRSVADPDAKKELTKITASWQSSGGQRSMLDVATRFGELHTSQDDLNSDIYLLNCANGALELKSGRFREHRATDLCTQQIQHEYKNNSECPIWEEYLKTTFDGDTELIGYMQRVLGYCLTGDVSEQVFFFLYGGGANGKSVFLAVLEHLLGSYACTVPTKMLLAKFASNSDIPADVAKTAGHRIATAGEVKERDSLDETFIKDFTGGDRIAARFLNKNYFEFRPQAKLFTRGNSKPKISGTDHGIWRRIRLVPFNVQIPEEKRDPYLFEKLKLEMSGILGWSVMGCAEWLNGGLRTPASVENAINEYRSEQDVLGDFLTNFCEIHEDFSIPRHELFLAYQAWSKLVQGRSQHWDKRRFSNEISNRLRIRGINQSNTTIRVNGQFDRNMDGIKLVSNFWELINDYGNSGGNDDGNDDGFGGF